MKKSIVWCCMFFSILSSSFVMASGQDLSLSEEKHQIRVAFEEMTCMQFKQSIPEYEMSLSLMIADAEKGSDNEKISIFLVKQILHMSSYCITDEF